MVDQALIEKLTALLKDHTEVCAAYLFGSRARGSHTSTSDVDIAVAFAPATSAWHEVELQKQLAVQLAMPVQVVDLARAGPHLVKAVSREGIPLVGTVPVAVEDYTSMGAERPEEAGTDPRGTEALWLLESAADKVRRLDRALPLLTDVVLQAVLAGEMTAVRNFIGVFMLLIEPMETLVRRVARYANLMLGHAEPEATLRAQTALAAQVLGLSAAAVEGIGAMARLRGQLAHAYWELDEAALAPVGPERLQPVLEHLVERASRFVLVEQARWQRHGQRRLYPRHPSPRLCRLFRAVTPAARHRRWPPRGDCCVPHALGARRGAGGTAGEVVPQGRVHCLSAYRRWLTLASLCADSNLDRRLWPLPLCQVY